MHWRHINVDKTMFQPFMVTEAYSEEFVLRFRLFGAFHIVLYPYLLINRNLLRHVYKYCSSFISRILVWLKRENIDIYSKTHPILE